MMRPMMHKPPTIIIGMKTSNRRSNRVEEALAQGPFKLSGKEFNSSDGIPPP